MSTMSHVKPINEHDQSPPRKRLKFEDLLTPEQKQKSQKAAEQEKLQQRFDQEIEEATDSIVTSYNKTEEDKLKYIGTIYTFKDYLDDYNQEGPHYHYWTKWLQEIMKTYPQLPKMKIVLSPFDDYKGCAKPRIETKLY